MRENLLARHWTEKIFVEHAPLYLKIHEEFLKSAAGQADQICSILGKHGVKRNGRILDLGCGIGRHSVHLAKLGYHVVGVDLSPMFLKRARELAANLRVSQRVHFIQCDYRSLDRCLRSAHDPFDAVINMWSTIGYYTDDADIGTLRQCLSHSRRGAILMIETINSEFLAKHFRPTDYSEFGDILLLEERKMSLERARVNTSWRFYHKRGKNLAHQVSVRFEFRVYTLHELISILERAGWRYLEASGGLEQGPLTPDTRTMLVLAETV